MKIVALCVMAAVAYGILHDLVTAHICIEYFSEWHPNPLDLHDPLLLALFWGVVATWWMGGLLGLALAAGCRAGCWPKLGWRDILRKVALLLLASAGLAALAGWAGYNSGGLAGKVFGVAHNYGQGFDAVLAAHNVSYTATFFGAIFLCLFTVRRRRRLAHLNEPGGMLPT